MSNDVKININDDIIKNVPLRSAKQEAVLKQDS